eukprot:4915812-Lingulodinium_polyedra.AAC.1
MPRPQKKTIHLQSSWRPVRVTRKRPPRCSREPPLSCRPLSAKACNTAAGKRATSSSVRGGPT